MGAPPQLIIEIIQVYSSLHIASHYLRYLLTASNGRGHGIHSPLVYDFVSKVLSDRSAYPVYQGIEAHRRRLLKDATLLQVEDFGAGSRVHPLRNRQVKDIAASSLKPAKYAQLLYRMVRHYQPATVLELGTSLGITAAYLASGLPAGGQLITCEGAPAVAAKASSLFQDLGLQSVRMVEGNFDLTLPPLLLETGRIDFAFIDGNHREAPTLAYFEALLGYAHPRTILVFDDVHWSEGMESAWKQICAHRAVTLSVDLFFIGIVMLNPDVKEKQHFTIRY